MDLMNCVVILLCILLTVWGNRTDVETIGSCKAKVGRGIINLKPLAAIDGNPRYTAEYRGWNYSYNPCASFNQPQLDPYNVYGDGCLYVMVCQSKSSKVRHVNGEYYTLAVQESAEFLYIPNKGSGTLRNQRGRSAKTGGRSGKLLSTPNGEEDESVDKNNDDKDENENDDDDYDDDEKDDNDGKTTRRLHELESHVDTYFRSEDVHNEEWNVSHNGVNGRLALTFTGYGSYKKRKTLIFLKCDTTRIKPEDAIFKVLPSSKRKPMTFELIHLCACPGACSDDDIFTANIQIGEGGEAEPENDEFKLRHILIMVAINAGILITAVVLGILCCWKGRKGYKGAGNSTGGFYSYLPGIHGSRFTVHSMESSIQPAAFPGLQTSLTHIDGSVPSLNNSLIQEKYSLSSLTQLQDVPESKSNQSQIRGTMIIDTDDQEKQILAKRPKENVMLCKTEVSIGHRLGGGLYSDTYSASYKDEPVAAKRITVGVHQRQLRQSDHDWVLKEVAHLRNQKYRSLVSVLGLFDDGTQPYVMTEFVDGQSLKDVLRKQDDKNFLTWREKIKLLVQAAEGMSFLHSATPQILHRDLRCANLLVNMNGELKVVDFGMTRIVQRLRMRCTGKKNCYCRKDMSAFPASIRWTPPEVLGHPQRDERSGVFTPACDVYSFSMVMWEVAETDDPFAELQNESDVIEVVQCGGRPRTEAVRGWAPQYKDLMAACWEHVPTNRPCFKRVIGHLKATLQLMEHNARQQVTHSVQPAVSLEQNTKDSAITNYIKTAFNV